METEKDETDRLNEDVPKTKTTEEPMKKVNLDSILVEEIGQFGRYQIRTLTLTAVVMVFVASAATEYIFTTARITTRCLIRECEGSVAAEFSPAWILNAIPAISGSFGNYQRFESINETIRSDSKCSAEWFNRKKTVGCTEYMYENTQLLTM